MPSFQIEIMVSSYCLKTPCLSFFCYCLKVYTFHISRLFRLVYMDSHLSMVSHIANVHKSFGCRWRTNYNMYTALPITPYGMFNNIPDINPCGLTYTRRVKYLVVTILFLMNVEINGYPSLAVGTVILRLINEFSINGFDSNKKIK